MTYFSNCATSQTMKEKLPMSRYDLRHTLASVIASVAMLSSTGCGGGSEAQTSANPTINQTPVVTTPSETLNAGSTTVVTENNATPVVSPSNTGNGTETKAAVKIPAEIPKSGQMVADASGNLYIADRIKCSIIKVTPGGEASLFAGRSRKCPDTSIQPKDGMGDQAEFGYPNAITIDTSGNIYVADNDDVSLGSYRVVNKGSSIRKITPEGVVTQFAGSFIESGYIDSGGKNARFSRINSLTADDEGNIYAADISNGVVRKLQPNGDVTTHFNLAPFKLFPYFIQYDGMNKFYILSSDGLGDVFLYKDVNEITRLSIWYPYGFSYYGLQVDRSNGDIYIIMPDKSVSDYYVAGGQVAINYKAYRSNNVSTQKYSSDYLNNLYEVASFVDGNISMTVVSPGVLAVLNNGKISRISKK